MEDDAFVRHESIINEMHNIMSQLLKALGCLWAAPVTFFGAAYSLSFWAAGWYEWHGIEGSGLVWTLNYTKAPRWLVNLWRGWAGHAIGNVVVLSVDPKDKPTVLIHELKHVDQVMRLGIFQPIVYSINMLAIKVGCTDSDPYFDNCFEIDARRHAGQMIDVVGVNKKLATAVVGKDSK